MDNTVFFSGISQTETLFLDYIFNEFNIEPILFTVRDSEYNLYLCLCYEMRKSLEWIVSKISYEDLSNLINKKKSIREVLLSGTKIMKIIRNTDFSYTVMPFNLTEDDELLPDNKVLLRCNFEMANAYLDKVLNRKTINFYFEQSFSYTAYESILSDNVYLSSREYNYSRTSLYEDEDKDKEIKKNSKNFCAA